MAKITVHPECKHKFAFAESCLAPSVLPYFEFWLHHAEPIELNGFKLLQLVLKDNGTRIVRTRGCSSGPRESPKGRLNVTNFYYDLQKTKKLNRVDKQSLMHSGFTNMPCSRVLRPSALQTLVNWMMLENPEDSVYAIIECLRGILAAVRIQTDLPDHKNRRNFHKYSFNVTEDRSEAPRPRPSSSNPSAFREVTTDKRYSTRKMLQGLRGAGNLTNWMPMTAPYGKSNYQEQFVTQNMAAARPSTHLGSRTSVAVTVCPDTLRFDQTFYRSLFAAKPE